VSLPADCTAPPAAAAAQDNIALVPFLDLLNHSPSVQVCTEYDRVYECFVLRTLTRCPKHHQVFINYGPHDNQQLLLDYGFITEPNPHDCITLTLHDVCCAVDWQPLATQLKFIQEKQLTSGLVISCDGVSWNLETLLLVCCCNHQLDTDLYVRTDIARDRRQHVQQLILTIITQQLRCLPSIDRADPTDIVSDWSEAAELAERLCHIQRDILLRCQLHTTQPPTALH